MDKSKMLELLKKKKQEGKSNLSEPEKKAKLGVLDSLRSEASDMMGDHLKGLKKVTVAAPTQEGLKKGLEVAKSLTAHKDELLGSDEESSEEECPECGMRQCRCGRSEESSEEESSESEEAPEQEEKSISEMSEQEIDAKLQELMAQKEKLSKREI